MILWSFLFGADEGFEPIECDSPVDCRLPPAGPQRHHNLIDFLLWYPKFPVRIGSRNFEHCHSFHSLFPPPAAVVSLPPHPRWRRVPQGGISVFDRKPYCCCLSAEDLSQKRLPGTDRILQNVKNKTKKCDARRFYRLFSRKD